MGLPPARLVMVVLNAGTGSSQDRGGDWKGEGAWLVAVLVFAVSEPAYHHPVPRWRRAIDRDKSSSALVNLQLSNPTS